MKSIWLWFWILTAIGCYAWYAIATVYIAVRGATDIRGMLAHLRKENESSRQR